MIDTLLFFWLLLKSALFTTGGLGNLPVLYEDLVSRGWATEQQFAEALSISKITPGPTGLWVISLAYLLDGLRGTLVAMVALTLPPLLIVFIEKLYQVAGPHALMEGFVRGLSLAMVGVFCVTIVEMIISNGVDVVGFIIIGLALWLGSLRQVPFIALLLGAGLVGVFFYM